MVTSFGMSPELGLVTIGEQGGEVFLGASLQELGSVGPATLELIDREVERLVAEAVERATAVLRAQLGRGRSETAQALLEHETLSGVALEALLDAGACRSSIDDAAASPGGGRSSDRAARAVALVAVRSALAAPRGRAATPRWRLEQPRAAAGRAVQGAARRARRPDVLGAEPRPAGGRGQQRRPARHPRLRRRVAGTRSRRSAAAPATRCGSRGPGRPSSGRSASRAARARARARRCAASRTAQVVGSYSHRRRRAPTRTGR